jgi:hypothetical protein
MIQLLARLNSAPLKVDKNALITARGRAAFSQDAAILSIRRG